VIGSAVANGAITKAGAGTLTFGNVANTFDGGLTVNAGVVAFANNAAFGTGTLTLAGGTVTSGGTGMRTLANDLILGGNVALAGADGRHYVFASSNVVGSAGTLTIDNTGDSGVASVGFSGAGFTVSSAFAFADAFAELRLLNPTGTQTFAGPISGSGVVRRNAAGGTTILSGNNASFSGGVSIDAGTVALGHDGALGSGTLLLNGGTIAASGGARAPANAISLLANSTIGGADNLTFSGGLAQATGDRTLTVSNTGLTTFSANPIVLGENNQTRTLVLDVAGTSGGLMISSVIQDGAGSGADSLTKFGSGTLTLSGPNIFSGLTTIGAGTLKLGAAGDAANTPLGRTTAGTRVSSGATLDLAGFTLGAAEALMITGYGVGSAGAMVNSGAAAVYSGNVTLGAASSIGGTGNIILSAGLIGNSLLTKVGANTLTLNAPTTRAGGTQIDAGIVKLGSSTGLSAIEQTVTLNGGGLQLATDSSVGTYPVVVAASSVIISDRATSGAGIVHTLGSLDLANASTLSIAAGANVSDGTASVAFGATFLSATGAVVAPGANTLLTLGSVGGNARSFSVTGAGDATISGAITTGSGGITKSGSGTLTLSGTNTYSGTTAIDAGVVSLQSPDGLGSSGAGTTVAGGAELQLNNTAVGGGASVLTVAAEPLTINGSGAFGQGALRSVSGPNVYAGVVTLGSSSLITANNGQSLTLSGGITASQNLTIGTTVENGSVTVAANMTNGTGTLTKDGSGSFTFSGFTGNVGRTYLLAGTLAVGGNSTLSTAEFAAAPVSTLAIATGGRVIANYAVITTVFSGAMSGGGTFQKDGAGALVFNRTFTAPNLSLVLNGGTLALISGAQITVGTIHITGNTTLDFGNSAGTLLSSGILIIDAGISVTVNNWMSIAGNADLSSVWYATGTVNGGALGGGIQVGGAPLGQIVFSHSPDSSAMWIRSQNG
jgi:autotransporter-associated beta strand protein